MLPLLLVLLVVVGLLGRRVLVVVLREVPRGAHREVLGSAASLDVARAMRGMMMMMGSDRREKWKWENPDVKKKKEKEGMRKKVPPHVSCVK